MKISIKKGKRLFLVLGLLGILNLSNPMHAIEREGNPEVIEISLWDGVEPINESGLSPESEVVENPGWISMVVNPVLYVYPASEPNGLGVLMCPGGGYYGVAIEHEGRAIAKMLAEKGITCGVLKYRMPNHNWKVPSEDVARAMAIMQENASKWGIKEGRIGIGGASAGGHLASTYATHAEGPGKPAFQILLYPVVTMDKTFTHEGSREALLGENPSDELVKEYSNELCVTPDTPAAFIAVSANDKVVPVKNSIEYFNALQSNGVPVSLFVYPTGGHGWGYNPDFIHNEAWTSELFHWLGNLQFEEKEK